MSAGKSKTIDPVCKLLSPSYTLNQEERLCAVVMTTSYFRRTKLSHPQPQYVDECIEMKISFKSVEARNIVGEMTFWQRGTLCKCRDPIRRNIFRPFYISWAYAPNEVFVFKAERGGTYRIENLTVNVLGTLYED